jgi:hypothetical protein
MARYSTSNPQPETGTGTNPNHQSRSTQFAVSRKGVLTLVRFLTWSGIGFVALLNVQPWIELAQQISKQLTNIPFLDSLVKIPFLGGWIEWGFLNLVAILGIVLWGITQLMEILPSLTVKPSQLVITYRYVAYAFEAIICFLRFPPYEGGINALIEDSPNWDASLIDWWLLVLFLVTMFSFEAIFHLIRNIRANL